MHQNVIIPRYKQKQSSTIKHKYRFLPNVITFYYRLRGSRLGAAVTRISLETDRSGLKYFSPRNNEFPVYRPRRGGVKLIKVHRNKK